MSFHFIYILFVVVDKKEEEEEDSSRVPVVEGTLLGCQEQPVSPYPVT